NITDAPGNTIGGTTAAARNIISGHNLSAVSINGSGATNNLVQGNYIGTDVTGTHSVPNNFLISSPPAGAVFISDASHNQIGGTSAGAGNLISGNKLSGVLISGATASDNKVQGNLIGTTPD